MKGGPSELNNIIGNVEKIKNLCPDYIEIIKKYHGNPANAMYFIEAGVKILEATRVIEKTVEHYNKLL